MYPGEVMCGTLTCKGSVNMSRTLKHSTFKLRIYRGHLFHVSREIPNGACLTCGPQGMICTSYIKPIILYIIYVSTKWKMCNTHGMKGMANRE